MTSKWFAGSTARVLVACLCVVACVLACEASGASARTAYLLTGVFGSAGTTPSNPYPLSASGQGPTQVAVDESTGDVYVTDPGNYRIEKFTGSGVFLLMFGKDVNATTGGDVCTVASGDVCKAGIPGTSPGAFDPNPNTYDELYVAVDNSLSASRGDVYVADRGDSLVTKFDSEGELLTMWGDGGPSGEANGQLKGSGATGPVAGPFTGRFKGIAVDESGNLWVVGNKPKAAVFEFQQNAAFVTDWAVGGSEVNAGIAVDGEDNVYLADGGKFTSSGVQVGFTFAPSTLNSSLTGVAFDRARNDIYYNGEYRGEGLRIDIVSASCVPTPTSYEGCGVIEYFSPTAPGLPRESWGLAVESNGTVFTASKVTGQVLSFAPEVVPDVSAMKASGLAVGSATLNGTVNPNGVALHEGLEGCRFEWGLTSSYGHQAPCDKTAAQIGTGSVPVQVSAPIAGLEAGKTYHFRLVAANANDVNMLVDEPSESEDSNFGPPLIEGEYALNVASSSATLQAEVDPNNDDTTARIVFGKEGYAQSTGEVDLGAGGTTQVFGGHVQGLSPGTVYHYRVIATSSLGTSEGEEHTFITQSGGGEFVLPDGRAWELVSPANKNGALIDPIGNANLIQAASSGGAVSYPASRPFEADAYGGYLFSGAQVFSEHGPNGWFSRGIDLPHAVASGIPIGGDYKFFSEDLSLAVVVPYEAEGGFTSMAPEVFPPDTEKTPYLRHDSTCVSVPGQCYEPLVTEAEGYSDVTASKVEFGGGPSGTFSLVKFNGASPDGTHVVVSAPALLEHAPPFGLYEWSADAAASERLALLDVLPEDEQKSPGETANDAALGYEVLTAHAVSINGDRVLWTGGKPGSSGNEGHLYMRDVAKGETIRLDLVEGRSDPTTAPPKFNTASSDGRYVFFTDESPLTKDSGASFGAGDLYECEIIEVEVAGRLKDKCELRDLTPEPPGVSAGKHEPADVQGITVGASEDGSYVYFVANGSLGAGTTTGTCSGGQEVFASTCNLFVSHDGMTSFIAALSNQDFNDWKLDLKAHTVRVSPDGVWLAFMSDRALTGYDNRDAVSGVPDEEVYLYNAETKKLVCASCDPTGGRPVGVPYHENELTGGSQVWNVGRLIAANIPGWTNYETGSALHQSRFLSNSGRLFFNSSDALVPLDINGTEDVYEFEPVGVGGASGCTASSSTYSGVSGGCVSLVSSGASSRESAFLDASESGDDVFFLTFDRLVSSDVDSAVDVYDAHVCGSGWVCAAPVVAPPACSTADACRAAPSPQPVVFGAPASATFSGAGNATGGSGSQVLVSGRGALTRAQLLVRALRACRKHGLRSARAACEARARRRFAGRQASRRVRVHSRGVRRGRRGA